MFREMTEDEVRDYANTILKFKNEKDVKAGVGQLTSFNSLGFVGVKDRPDGWYLPDNKNNTAIILEAKSSSSILNENHKNELLKNIKIANQKYKNVIGILYNGYNAIIYKNDELYSNDVELKNKEYYLGLYNENKIDKQQIYNLTKKINDCLHTEFGIKNLYHRMIFTACALVAKRYGASLFKGMNYQTFHTSIHSTLAKSLADSRKQNQKLNLLLDVGFNKEVGKDGALYWNKEDMNLANLIDRLDKISESEIQEYSNRAKKRIIEDYSWDKIVEKYEDVFMKG